MDDFSDFQWSQCAAVWEGEQCPKGAHKSKLCKTHYRRRCVKDENWQRPVKRRDGMPRPTCPCGRKVHRNGLCRSHADGVEKGLPADRPLKVYVRLSESPGTSCSIPLCILPKSKAGLCQQHYRRHRLGEEDWRRPIRPKQRGKVRAIGPLNVNPLIHAALRAESNKKGITMYRLRLAILDEWWRKWRDQKDPEHHEFTRDVVPRADPWAQPEGFSPDGEE